MNYGYKPTEKDQELAKQIGRFLEAIPPDKHGQRPYIEIGGYFPGVRVRRLTHYTQEQLEDIIRGMDSIHAEITGTQTSHTQNPTS